MIEDLGATRTGARGDATATDDAMRANGYAPHDAALDFEARFGGYEFRDAPDDAPPSLVIGTYACMQSGFTRWPDGGATTETHQLVPVILAADDIIYYVGRDGRGWVQWMNDAAARPIADDGAQLVTMAILWRALEVRGGFLGRDGHHGAAIAAERGLDPIAAASSAIERWWGRPGALVVETITEERGAMTYWSV